MKNKIDIEKDLVEYDGVWHKKGEDDNCDKFTMVDLKEILEEQKEKILELVLEDVPWRYQKRLIRLLKI